MAPRYWFRSLSACWFWSPALPAMARSLSIRGAGSWISGSRFLAGQADFEASGAHSARLAGCARSAGDLHRGRLEPGPGHGAHRRGVAYRAAATSAMNWASSCSNSGPGGLAPTPGSILRSARASRACAIWFPCWCSRNSLEPASPRRCVFIPTPSEPSAVRRWRSKRPRPGQAGLPAGLVYLSLALSGNSGPRGHYYVRIVSEVSQPLRERRIDVDNTTIIRVVAGVLFVIVLFILIQRRRTKVH